MIQEDTKSICLEHHSCVLELCLFGFQCCVSKPFVQSSFSESLKLLHTYKLVVTRTLLGFFFFQLRDNLKVIVLFPNNAENVSHLWFYLLL